MTRDDIIRMATDAGFIPDIFYWDTRLERFAALVAAAEREECAKVCEDMGVYVAYVGKTEKYPGEYASYEDRGYGSAIKDCAPAIRARGQA